MAATPFGSTPISPGLYRWMITLDGRAVRKGTAPSRDEAADAVHGAPEN
jgi:hypothetical protein